MIFLDLEFSRVQETDSVFVGASPIFGVRLGE